MSEHTPETITSPEPPSSSARWRTRLFKFLRIGAYTLVVIPLLLAFIPVGLRLGGEYWLNKQPGIDANIGNIDFNLFSATFVLEDLNIEYQGITHTRIERLAVAGKYLPLWDSHARIDYIELQGVRLMLEQFEADSAEDPRALRIGGLVLPRSEAGGQSRDATAKTEQSTSPWGFGWNRITVDDTEIVWRQPEWSADLIIEHAYLNDVASWKPNSDSELHLQLRLNDAPVSVTAQTRPFATQRSSKGQIKIDAFALGKIAPILAPAGVHDIAGIFSCDLKYAVSLSDAGDITLGWDGSLALTQEELSTAQVHIADGELRWDGEGSITTTPEFATRVRLESTLQLPVLDVQALESGMALQQEGLRWDGTVAISFKQGSDPELEIDGDLTTAKLNIVDRAHGRLLASWEELKGSGLAVHDGRVQLKQLHIGELVALRPSTDPAETEPPLAQCGTLALVDLGMDLAQEDGGSAVTLESLTLSELGVEVIRYASGHTNIEQWSTSTAATTEKSANSRPSEVVAPSARGSEEENSAPSPLRWRLNVLQVEEGSYINFTDATAEPDVTLEINALNVQLKDLDSSAVDTRNPLKLDAKLGRFATLKAEGGLSVLAPEPEGDLELELHGFQLYSIASYIEETIGARIERGELDLSANASIENNVLGLESQVALRSFTLGAMTPEQQERISSNLGMPLSLALALLRDEKGDIHLNIPASGDLSSPDIAIESVVRKALFGAVQETVKLALKPLGIISGAGNLLGIGRELTLPPVEFNPGQETLTDPATALKPLRDLLAQRPQLRVILSAHLSEADIAALRSLSKDEESKNGEKVSPQNQEGKITEEPAISEDEFRVAATALLRERLHAVKGWLLNDGEVHNNQVLLTQPRLTPLQGEPRVEMRF